jgi:hypothetical protein
MSEDATTLTLHFKLLSPATFGRGEGLAGLVDQEVEHDDLGLPYLRGRALRGLLAEEMESLLYALGDHAARWLPVRDRLLGRSGELTSETGILHIGNGCFSENLTRLVAVACAGNQSKITSTAILNATTAIRRQTAMTPLGAPEPASLRATRVVLRGTRFEAALRFAVEPLPEDISLLTATVLAWRRAGTSRNRGRGRVMAWIEDEIWTRTQFERFCREVEGL